jgi:3' terminal RNA ribose 2'-O-methyltransferase Hen1
MYKLAIHEFDLRVKASAFKRTVLDDRIRDSPTIRKVLLTIGAPIPAVDLGYLLHKNPSRLHSFDLAFGKAHVFYPRSSSEESTAVVLLDVDPVGLVRGRVSSAGEGSLDQYVNDRPYVSSSFLSVALSRVLGTAMGGRSKERQELADMRLDWTATVAVVNCRGGDDVVRALFQPLGYFVQTDRHPLDERFPEWGDGPYFTIRLRGQMRLSDLLTHIYVLIPVLDAEKHYWVGDDEVAKLLQKGEGWLSAHPEKGLIAARYLRYNRKLTRDALSRLTDDSVPDPEADEEIYAGEEARIEEPLRLWEQRIGAVVSALKAIGAKSVIDLGCGEGKLLRELLRDKAFERLLGMDVSWRSIELAHKRLHLDQMSGGRRGRIDLIHGSLMYRDSRIEGFDAATLVEVIEHLDPPRLEALERVLFECAHPRAAIITTPNSEYNPKFAGLAVGQPRHKDHRFEWSRAEFEHWANGVAGRFGYRVRFVPVGPEDPLVGAPTQMAVFTT